MKIQSLVNCNNSPKNEFLKNITIDLLHKQIDPSLFTFDINNITLPKLSTNSILTIITAISHGKHGNVLIQIEGDASFNYLSFHYTFHSLKPLKISNVTITKGEKV